MVHGSGRNYELYVVRNGKPVSGGHLAAFIHADDLRCEWLTATSLKCKGGFEDLTVSSRARITDRGDNFVVLQLSL